MRRDWDVVQGQREPLCVQFSEPQVEDSEGTGKEQVMAENYLELLDIRTFKSILSPINPKLDK